MRMVRALTQHPPQLPLRFIPCAADTSRCRPFVKWAGGKSKLLPELVKHLPATFNSYFEPMLGGGALFFHLRPEVAHLSDINPELVNAYNTVKDEVSSLIRTLNKHVYSGEHYYKIRNADRRRSFSKWSNVRRAARLIYLNKTCYNGLYRVSAKGYFNTPFGKYVNPKIVDERNLHSCSAALAAARIICSSFEWVEGEAQSGDFIYFDPPYVPLNPTSNFTSYSAAGFDLEMQTRLRDLCERLSQRNVNVMISNSSAPIVYQLYADFNVHAVQSARSINSKGAMRGKIEELIITNY